MSRFNSTKPFSLKEDKNFISSIYLFFFFPTKWKSTLRNLTCISFINLFIYFTILFQITSLLHNLSHPVNHPTKMSFPTLFQSSRANLLFSKNSQVIYLQSTLHLNKWLISAFFFCFRWASADILFSIPKMPKIIYFLFFYLLTWKQKNRSWK